VNEDKLAEITNEFLNKLAQENNDTLEEYVSDLQYVRDEIDVSISAVEEDLERQRQRQEHT
jgi:hypothetical protein